MTGNWIFLTIVKKKKLLFDGVLENYTEQAKMALKM